MSRISGFRRVQRLLTIALVVAALTTFLAYLRKGKFVDPTDILPALLQQPIQKDTTRRPFSFDYMGETYNVKPVAYYELWGLVVSHNDPAGFGDIYHDETSVDTRDLGIIWGNSLRTKDFHKIKFSSNSWTLNYRHPAGVTVFPKEMSNSHLITSDQSIRDIIATVAVGDQAHLKGMLVDYQAAGNPGFWRRSSTTRDDIGNGACEVFFVDQIDILERGTPGWHLAYSKGWWCILIILVLKCLVLLVDVFATKRELSRN